MKNIVLYISLILLVVLQNASAQKPTIDLLPSIHERPHPEAIIDTSYTKDSLVLIVPGKNQPSEPTGEIQSEEIQSKMIQSEEIQSKESRKPGLHLDSILRKMVNHKVQPHRILIFYITALNI